MGAKRIVPDSFQWYPVIGQIAMAINSQTQEVSSQHQKWVQSTGTDCPERSWILPFWRHSKCTCSYETRSRWPCCVMEVGLDDLQRSFLTLTILSFSDSVKLNKKKYIQSNFLRWPSSEIRCLFKPFVPKENWWEIPRRAEQGLWMEPADPEAHRFFKNSLMAHFKNRIKSNFYDVHIFLLRVLIFTNWKVHSIKQKANTLVPGWWEKMCLWFFPCASD